MGEDVHPITALLRRWHEGDSAALGELVSLAYHELHAIAHARMRHVCREHAAPTTALVGELWEKLHKAQRPPDYQSRGHFYKAASLAVHHILLDGQRRGEAQKAGGGRLRIALESEEVLGVSAQEPRAALEIVEAIEALRNVDEELAEIVMRRVYGGQSHADVADDLHVSVDRVDRRWKTAIAWLREKLRRD